jgi:hypothetical protein
MNEGGPIRSHGESDPSSDKESPIRGETRRERVTLLGSSAEPVRARPPSLLGMGISTRDRKVQRVRS